ncbi:DUF1636 family protein [Leptolyngbyaceae cyanobacterium UHCC 1019]
MTQHTLFICQSCHSSEDRPEHQPTDGAALLEQVKTHQANSSSDIRVQPVGCLWACDRPLLQCSNSKFRF